MFVLQLAKLMSFLRPTKTKNTLGLHDISKMYCHHDINMRDGRIIKDCFISLSTTQNAFTTQVSFTHSHTRSHPFIQPAHQELMHTHSHTSGTNHRPSDW